MRAFRSLLAAVFFLAAGPAFAQPIEGVPNFKECKDDLLDRAMKDGVTLGISPSPPYSSLDPSSNKAEGLDVEINEAALKWIASLSPTQPVVKPRRHPRAGGTKIARSGNKRDRGPVFSSWQSRAPEGEHHA